MASYHAIDDVEHGKLATGAPASNNTPRTTRATKLTLGLTLAFAALAGFAAGTKIGPASAPSTLAVGAAHKKKAPAYIIKDCVWKGRYGIDMHAEYFAAEDASDDQQYFGEGWYCAYGDAYPGHGPRVLDIDFQNSAPFAHHVTEFDDTTYKAESYSDPLPYDAANIRKDCIHSSTGVFFDQDYGAWRCLDEDDFHASGLAEVDFAYLASNAAIATYKSYPDGVDLWGKGGLFVEKNLSPKPEEGVWEMFQFDHGKGWTNTGGAQEFTAQTYYSDKRENIEGTDRKLWRVTPRKPYTPDTTGYYLVKKQCNDDGSCYLNFVCTEGNTADVLSDDC